MTISFEIEGNDLLLCYAPEMGTKGLIDQLQKNGSLTIKHTYTVTRDRLIREENDFVESLVFRVGNIGEEYTEIDTEVLGTTHRIFFSNDIPLMPKMFTAYRNISIMRKLDEVINHDLYIGGAWEDNSGMPIEAYKELLNSFPKTAELDKYAYYRISACVSEYFPEADRFEKIYKDYLNKKQNDVYVKPSRNNLDIEIAQFTEVYKELKSMLNGSCSYKEKVWQPKIHNIIQMIYPQYILSVREIIIKGIDKNDPVVTFLKEYSEEYKKAADMIKSMYPDVDENNNIFSSDLVTFNEACTKLINYIKQCVENPTEIYVLYILRNGITTRIFVKF